MLSLATRTNSPTAPMAMGTSTHPPHFQRCDQGSKEIALAAY
jgi:hypothetical protein